MPAEPVGAGDVSCAISTHSMNAQTISWASQGGIAPMEHNDSQPLTSFQTGPKPEKEHAQPGRRECQEEKQLPDHLEEPDHHDQPDHHGHPDPNPAKKEC